MSQFIFTGSQPILGMPPASCPAWPGLKRPDAANMVQLLGPGASATFLDTPGGPLSMTVPPGQGYTMHAVGMTPPTSGSWAYEFLIESLPLPGAMGLYAETAAGAGLAVYQYNGSLYMQLLTGRNTYSTNLLILSFQPTPSMWLKMGWDGAKVTVSISSNRITYDPIGDTASGLAVPTFIGQGCVNYSNTQSLSQHLWNLTPA